MNEQKQDNVRVAVQINNDDPQVFEGDGLILATVTRTGGGHLSVTPCVQCLTYDEIARALMATQVSIWQEFVGERMRMATLTKDTYSIDEFWPAYKYRCETCGKTFFGGISDDPDDNSESILGFCPTCGAKFEHVVEVEGEL